jgi:hypothetical protein
MTRRDEVAPLARLLGRILMEVEWSGMLTVASTGIGKSSVRADGCS